jgi:hypothetical protein
MQAWELVRIVAARGINMLLRTAGVILRIGSGFVGFVWKNIGNKCTIAVILVILLRGKLCR